MEFARIPLPRGLVAKSTRIGFELQDQPYDHAYSGCLVPGHPELKPLEPDFCTRFDRTVSYLRKNGLVVGFGIPAEETGEG